ncbi:MAG: Dyp-type peroxidase [Bacteroidota bacterium]
MQIEKEDIQGLILRGYKGLPSASYAVLKCNDPAKAKAYLQDLSHQITNAVSAPKDYAMHLAFTYEGLKFLGLNDKSLYSFSQQFKEGMTEAHRRFILGDTEDNAPSSWDWGGPDNDAIHLMLLIYAKDQPTLDQAYDEQKGKFSAHDLTEITYLSTQLLNGEKEHFGFRDGVSQPILRGVGKGANLPDEKTIPLGEFILGYQNWYNQYPDSPEVEINNDLENILPNKAHNSSVKDLGKNGSYMVFRQLSQNVCAFWEYLKKEAIEPGAADQEEAAIKLASKMVGRWPSGAPLVKSPDKDEPSLSHDNDFLFWNEDKHGLKCPLGSHIRRTNPRDWLLTEKSALESQEMVQKHRILRRGRAYGPPLVASMDTKALINAPEDNQERGLHFLCFAGDIIRQFEFMQNAWVKFHKFGGTYEDSDPLIGTHYKKDGIVTDTFTVQAQPVRRRYQNMPQFSKMKGGEYFFFPGIKAIKYIASL